MKKGEFDHFIKLMLIGDSGKLVNRSYQFAHFVSICSMTILICRGREK